MGGPIDTRRNPTAVNLLAEKKGTAWFRDNVVMQVPWPLPGFGRDVYPGFLQLSGFMSMNLDRHIIAHKDFYMHLVKNDGDGAEKHREFYDEYLGKRKFKRHTFLREEADQNRELASFIESIRHEIVFRTAFGKSASPRMAAAVMVAYQSGHFSLEELRASFFYWKLGDDGSITVEPGMAGWILVGTIGFFMIAITLYSGLVIYELLSANSLPAFAMAFALFVVVLIYFQHFGREARAVFAATCS